MNCFVTKYVVLRVRSYENVFKQRCPNEDEGFSTLDEYCKDALIKICWNCSLEGNVYPLDWILKVQKHGKSLEKCIRCCKDLYFEVPIKDCPICQ